MRPLLARASEDNDGVHRAGDVQESDHKQDQQRYDESELDDADAVVATS